MLLFVLRKKEEIFEDLDVFFLLHLCYIRIFLLHLGSQSTFPCLKGLLIGHCVIPGSCRPRIFIPFAHFEIHTHKV